MLDHHALEDGVTLHRTMRSSYTNHAITLHQTMLSSCTNHAITLHQTMLSSCTGGAGSAEKHFAPILRKRRMTVTANDFHAAPMDVVMLHREC